MSTLTKSLLRAGLRRSNTIRLCAVLAVLAMAAGVLPASAAAVPAASAPAMRPAVTIAVGKSALIELPGAYSDVMIADPKIADILPLNSHSVYVVGKGMGATSLTVYGAGKRVIYSSDVVVSADIEGFKTRLHEILPEETRIAASAANQSIVLSGTASSPASLQKALSLAETYDPGKIVNMVSVEGTQQVMLSVRFVEMERTTAKDLRLNVQQTPTVSTNPQVTVTTGDTLVNAATTTLNTFGTASLLWRLGGGDLTVMFDALEKKGLIKTLAEPTLVAMSGDTASFLAGGEFPIPVNQSSSNGTTNIPTITVEFKQFGISLAFTPTILQDGLINMVVNPEVSSIDPTTAVKLGIIEVPGIKIRRAHTTVELRDGESFTIAGLMSDNYQNSINQYPFIGDLPVIGALFRSTGFQHDQTELVIVVTPHIVTPRRAYAATPADRFVPPSDFELFLFGTQRGSTANLSPADRALLSLDPTKGGVDGPYGHVLY
ncbi:MAG TPA: type II and III secretion system protein family protein [Rhizomicrobium sp.]|nr:type II and III secretion system protein family protein [Rhizomicrobium sp.]